MSEKDGGSVVQAASDGNGEVEMIGRVNIAGEPIDRISDALEFDTIRRQSVPAGHRPEVSIRRRGVVRIHLGRGGPNPAVSRGASLTGSLDSEPVETAYRLLDSLNRVDWSVPDIVKRSAWSLSSDPSYRGMYVGQQSRPDAWRRRGSAPLLRSLLITQDREDDGMSMRRRGLEDFGMEVNKRVLLQRQKLIVGEAAAYP